MLIRDRVDGGRLNTSSMYGKLKGSETSSGKELAKVSVRDCCCHLLYCARGSGGCLAMIPHSLWTDLQASPVAAIKQIALFDHLFGARCILFLGLVCSCGITSDLFFQA